MRFTLTTPRRPIENHINTVEWMLASFPTLVPRGALDGELKIHIYTVFSQYLAHIYSRCITPVDLEFLMFEYLWGRDMTHEERQLALTTMQEQFAHAHILLRPMLNQMVNQLESYGEEVEDVFVSFSQINRGVDQQLLLLVAETSPVDEVFGDPQVHVWQQQQHLTQMRSAGRFY